MKRFVMLPVLILLVTLGACTNPTTRNHVRKQRDLQQTKELDPRTIKEVKPLLVNISAPTAPPKISKEQAIEISKNEFKAWNQAKSIEAYHVKAHNGIVQGNCWIVIFKGLHLKTIPHSPYRGVASDKSSQRTISEQEEKPWFLRTFHVVINSANGKILVTGASSGPDV